MAWSTHSLLANCTFCKLRSILQVTNLSMGEAYLLRCLPSEVRVHIFCTWSRRFHFWSIAVALAQTCPGESRFA